MSENVGHERICMKTEREKNMYGHREREREIPKVKERPNYPSQ